MSGTRKFYKLGTYGKCPKCMFPLDDTEASMTRCPNCRVDLEVSDVVPSEPTLMPDKYGQASQ
jgi:hypothetical protein